MENLNFKIAKPKIMLPYDFQIPLGAILAIVDLVVIGIVEKSEVISVSKLIKSGLAVIAGK